MPGVHAPPITVLQNLAAHQTAYVEGGPRLAAWCLHRDSAVHRARALLRCELTALRIADELIGDVELVVAELASNAVRHARGPYELRVLYDRGVPVEAEVADAGTGADLVDELLDRPLVIPDSIEDLELGGRGLRLVAALTGGRCGGRQVRLCGTGRAGTGVWFGLPTQDRPA
ncbi:ATP-binding protein [Planotetraspora sp. GP83]|uniref:ATP-binding protein n=1 Tax=Planotetraspora sp. GP83 TaxID=3156264 RepID=UPI003513FC0D